MFFAFTVLSMIFVGGFLLFCAAVVCFKYVEDNFRRGGYHNTGVSPEPEQFSDPFYGYGPVAMEQYFMDEIDDSDNPFLYDEV
jgi:hypothetical protein